MKRILTLLLCGLLIFSLMACSTGNNGNGSGDTSGADGDSTSGAGEIEWIYPVSAGDPLMRIIYPTKAGDSEIAAATTVFEKVLEGTGVILSSDQDYVDPSDWEFLIGETNRTESIALMETLEPYEFAIRATGTKIVIVGWDDTCLMEGVDYFFSAFVPAFGAMKSGEFRVRYGAEYISDGSDNSTFWNSLLASDTLATEVSEHIFTMTKPGNTTWPQGGCVRDGYFYQAFIRKDQASNEENNDVIIVKYDIESGKLIQTSEVLDLNHCNDITYNSNLGYFVVCHNNPNRTHVSYVDPVTLTVVDTIHIEDKIYSIDYNAESDRYVVGLSGGQSFCFLDGNLERIDYFNVYQPTTRSAGCVTQSVTSDNEYIYFVLYNPNLITVYDWDGNFVTLIELDLGSIEPESITIVRNVFYIGCGTSSGAKVYKLASLVPKED